MRDFRATSFCDFFNNIDVKRSFPIAGWKSHLEEAITRLVKGAT